MNEELDLNLDELDQNADRTLQTKNRFQQLANDKRELTQKNELAEKATQEANDARAKAEKSLEFYKTFSTLSAKHPEATNYQDQILERVNKGYDPEEATLAVLAKEGKLSNQTQPLPPQRTPSAEGGSALNQLNEGEKQLDQMNVKEKLEALQEMEKSGELLQALRSGINRQ